MTQFLAVFLGSLGLAYISEQNTKMTYAQGRRYSLWGDWAYIALVLLLSLYTGLRSDYNDTWNYISGFRSAPGLAGFLADPENLNPFTNPLFYFFQSLLKEYTDNGKVLIFLTSAFTQVVFLWFIKKYAPHFMFSVFLYFTLGTFNVTRAAIKQVVAMAVLFIGIHFLEQRRWIAYYVSVIIAMLIHTYAMAFLLLPLLLLRPWRAFTYVFVAVLAFVMMNFEGTITAFMDQANELGKTLEDYEVFHEHSMNLLRVGVYAVVPAFSWVFQRRLFSRQDTMVYLLAHMSIISLAFMIMGTQGGANMFGRMAHYFEIGIICILPWMLDRVFERRSCRLVSFAAVVCFLGFFAYANGMI